MLIVICGLNTSHVSVTVVCDVHSKLTPPSLNTSHVSVTEYH